MLQPTERPPASRAPRLAASIRPGPPPVITVKPSWLTRRPTSRAMRVVRMRLVEARRPEDRDARPDEVQHAKPADEVAHRAQQRARSSLQPRVRPFEQRRDRIAGGAGVDVRPGPFAADWPRRREPSAGCRATAGSLAERRTIGVGVMDTASACARPRRRVRTARDRCRRPALPVQNSIAIGHERGSRTRTAGAARLAGESRARRLAHARSSSSRDASVSLCRDAHAPIWLSRGRVAKYASASASGTRVDVAFDRGPADRAPASTRRARRPRCASRSRALRLPRLVKNEKPRSSAY